MTAAISTAGYALMVLLVASLVVALAGRQHRRQQPRLAAQHDAVAGAQPGVGIDLQQELLVAVGRQPRQHRQVARRGE